MLSACSGIDEIPETPTPEDETPFVKSNLSRETSPSVTPERIQELANDNTAFALLFYNQIRQNEGNIIFSPISLSLALSMTMAGAETTTENAMLEALQLTLPEEEVYPAYNALLLAINQSEQENLENDEDSNFQLNIANSLWAQSGYGYKQAFLDILAKNFGAGVNNVNFIQDPEAARDAINNWVEEETEEKIKELIPAGTISDLTRLVLANAIYFKGAWRYQFDTASTYEAPFNLLDGSAIKVDMMKLDSERLQYHQGQDYEAISLPYMSPDFAMTIIVPELIAFNDFETTISLEFLNTLRDRMAHEQIELEMPKFDFESTINAKEALKNLGMEEAFIAGMADFSGITEEEELLITDVLHKATITVDEEGTEAAAATAVIVGLTSLPPEPISLKIDRPFMFFIQHQPTGSILFMGRVTQP
jgi:serpin B